MSSRAPLLIGIGNDLRGDDGVGPAVVRGLGQLAAHEGWRSIVAADPTQLVDAWSGAEVAVVVDAVICDPPNPGQVHRLSAAEILRCGFAGSTHGFGVPDALGLSQELGLAPKRLVLVAVEAESVQLGHGLSPKVADAMPDIIRVVAAELGAAVRPDSAYRKSGRPPRDRAPVR